MKAYRYLGIIVILAMLVALIPVGSVSAAGTKVDVCHFDKDSGTYFLIYINDNAFDAHVAHGDAAPGELVPGVPGMKFGADCSLEHALPQKELIGTYSVNSNGAIVYSAPLLLGQSFELKASGTYKYSTGTDWIADAKCSQRVPPHNPLGDYIGWVDGFLLGTTYGLQITAWDGNIIPPLAPLGWIETCNTSHIYTTQYTGTGGALGLFIWDNAYSDNSGYLTVEIWKINW